MNGKTISIDQKPDPLFKNQKNFKKSFKRIVLELITNRLRKKETHN